MTVSEKAQTAHDLLTAEIEALETSDDWRDALRVAARFHAYSFNNRLLIAAQARERGFEVTRVAGYRAWQRLDRQVRKGEKGLVILKPHRRKVEDDGGEERFVLSGFGVTSVFDVSQTDGEPLPELPRPDLLDGEMPEGIGRLEKLAADLGAPVTWDADEYITRTGANGYTDGRQIVVDPALSPAQRFKTLVHEIGHVILHYGFGELGGQRPDCRGRVEVEAESTAFVVSETLGFDTGSYSFSYVATWASRDGSKDDPSAIVRETGVRVVRAAERILAALDGDEIPEGDN